MCFVMCVPCKTTAGGFGGQLAKPGQSMEHALCSALLIWQCDVIHDEKGMKVIKNYDKYETL